VNADQAAPDVGRAAITPGGRPTITPDGGCPAAHPGRQWRSRPTRLARRPP